MTLQPGMRLAHYQSIEKLGEGGMGVVWKARDTTLGREVAVKLLPDASARDPERLARLEDEARAIAALNHPGIVNAVRARGSRRPARSRHGARAGTHPGPTPSRPEASGPTN